MRDLRKECEEGLADLPIPAPFTIEGLIAAMERARGRRIVLRELPERFARPGGACGLRLATPEVSLVLYRRRPTSYQTQHVVLHELCHEWFDHGTSPDAGQLARLLPVFDTELVRRVLGAGGSAQARAQYDTHDERVAELGASLVPRMAREAGSDDMVGRLTSSLARPVAHRRRGRPGRDKT
ncbi:toxin [Streptomyces sp. NPDC007088]|uniref:toxin n=1 Tax=Streptomyces sp. NPDC007088 TaxID=3364773 RepID=UPI0036A27A4F